MTNLTLSKSAEIDRNLVRFLELLPSLMAEHADQYVLLRHGKPVDFFATAIDAQIAGNQKFDDNLFSIQHITEKPEELGHYSYAIYSGKA